MQVMKGMNWEKVEVFKLSNTIWDSKKFEDETVKVNLLLLDTTCAQI